MLRLGALRAKIPEGCMYGIGEGSPADEIEIWAGVQREIWTMILSLNTICVNRTFGFMNMCLMIRCAHIHVFTYLFFLGSVRRPPVSRSQRFLLPGILFFGLFARFVRLAWMIPLTLLLSPAIWQRGLWHTCYSVGQAREMRLIKASALWNVFIFHARP